MRSRKEIESDDDYQIKDGYPHHKMDTPAERRIIEVLLDMRDQNEEIISLLRGGKMWKATSSHHPMSSDIESP